MDGGNGDDVMIGLLGSDTMHGGTGRRRDRRRHRAGHAAEQRHHVWRRRATTSRIWRGGDGSDAFIGGRGRDALVLGAIDRDAFNIPVIVPATGRYQKTGLPTADVTGQNGFCTLEDVRDQDLGYDFLVRFFVKSTGALAVTIRVADVEQVFCTSRDRRSDHVRGPPRPSPAFVEVSLDEVAGTTERSQIIR